MTRLRLFQLLLPLLLVLMRPAVAATDVWAAASLADVLDAAIERWEDAGGERVRANYAASSLLARQIAGGARADVFLSADGEWMEWLVERGRVAGEPRPLAGNRLVLIAPGAAAVVPASLGELPQALAGEQRLAVADTEHVPAGRYARAALEHLGLWPQLAARLAPFENVRATLQAVASGSLPLGIVYATDARAERAVRVVDTFPADSHPPVVYWVARLAGEANPAADAFLDWLMHGDVVARLLEEQGFSPPPVTPLRP